MQGKIIWYLIMLLWKQRRKKNLPANSKQNIGKQNKAKPALNGKLIGLGLFAFSGLSLAGLALFYYGTKIETRRYRLENLAVETEEESLMPLIAAVNAEDATARGGRPGRRYQNLKILHLSDLHLSGQDDHKVEFIRGITDDDYDLVVLTGDVFEFEHGLMYGEHLLSRKPRLGAYAVFGNHDYYDYSILNKTLGRVVRKLRHPPKKKDVTPHAQALRKGGFVPLVNESVHLADENIFIVGIDYPGIAPEHLQTIMDRAPAAALKLGLFHLPKKLDMLAQAGFHLAFGGHTHGGQVRLPGFGALVTDSELERHEASGLIKRGSTTFHISRGLGADPRSNIRLFCPPAATVIELRHGLYV